MCGVLNASHTDGKVVVTDKDEELLVRKAKEDLEQTTIQEVIEADFLVQAEPPQLPAPEEQPDDDAPADDEPEEPYMEEY